MYLSTNHKALGFGLYLALVLGAFGTALSIIRHEVSTAGSDGFLLII